MPYANRQKQLTYMRHYMKRKRMIDRIARLKQRKKALLHRFDTESDMKYFIKREEVGAYCDEEVKRLESLLNRFPKLPTNRVY